MALLSTVYPEMNNGHVVAVIVAVAALVYLKRHSNAAVAASTGRWRRDGLGATMQDATRHTFMRRNQERANDLVQLYDPRAGW